MSLECTKDEEHGSGWESLTGRLRWVQREESARGKDEIIAESKTSAQDDGADLLNN